MQIIQLWKSAFKALSLSQYNLLIALWLGIVLNIAFYQKIQLLTPYQGSKASLLLITTVVIIVAVYNLLMQLIQWRPYAHLLACILILVGGISAYFVSSLGVIISPDQIQNMVQTDVHELKDLFSIRMLIWFVVFCVLPMWIAFKLPIRSQPISQQILKKLVHIGCSLVVILAGLYLFYVDYAAIFREHRDLKGMVSPMNVISSSWSYYHKKMPAADLPLVAYGTDAHQVEKVTNTSLPKLMVMVVGETARAESFSLNGYPRLTNPELSKKQMINFSSVSSCGTATAVSVPCLFSGMFRANYDERLASHREGLLDIARRAGYQVTWIDNNSGCKGVCNRVEQFKIPESLKQKWCDGSGECADEILVDALRDYLHKLSEKDDKPRLIVLHQMGSHGPAYYKRALAPYRKFIPQCETSAIQGCSQQELINSYDNSIVYTDHVLSSIIDVLAKVEHYQTAFWYVSDHGESTGEHGLYLHGSPYAIAPSQQTHVPMMLWFSEAWQQQAQNQMNCLSRQTSNVLSHDYVFSSMLSVLGIKTNVSDPQFDLLKNCEAT